jgi:hypothetical protein
MDILPKDIVKFMSKVAHDVSLIEEREDVSLGGAQKETKEVYE